MELKQLLHHQGDFTLRVESFELTAGDVVFLHGLSGCGKTTLLNLLAGVRQSLYSAEVRQQFPKVSYVMHEPTMLPWKTVEANFRLEAALRDTTADIQSFKTLCDAFLLPKATLTRRAGELSLGMRQRVEIAKALAFRPQLVLLDEAFSGLDAASKSRVVQQLASAVEMHKLALVATAHQVPDVLRLARRVIVLDGGTVVKQIAVSAPLAVRSIMPIADLLHLAEYAQVVTALENNSLST